MRTVFALSLSCAAAALPAQPQAPNPQRLCFVGDPASQRAKDFAAFLRGRFAAVELVARADVDPARLQQADVVLLDWPQSDAARNQRAAGWSPLGERDGWHTPTVLLGSAGLNLAGAWQVRGGFG
jgi:hypothetical protein